MKKIFLISLIIILGGIAMPMWADDNIKAPEFPAGLNWINSQPLSMNELKGKVVLVDFWDYTCINCIRTLSYLKEWQERYSQYGLVIIGVHTPEFEFAKDLKNVSEAVKRFGITYPVVLDNDYKIWSLYANQYWPRKYIIDPNGYIVYDHAGEGAYHETELFMQSLLKEINPKAKLPKPYSAPGAIESGGLCYLVTPELYLGYERGRIGNTEGYKPNAVINYQDQAKYIDGYIYANGQWLNQPQSLKHARLDANLEDYIGIKYHGLTVNAVIKPGEASYRVYVKQDGSYVQHQDQGEDIKTDEGGKTYLEVDAPRMYRIIKNNKFGSHQLRLYSDSDAFDIYAFTFGSCEISK